MSTRENQAFNDGKMAFRDGLEFHHNPRRSVAQRCAWAEGFEDERRRDLCDKITPKERAESVVTAAKLKEWVRQMLEAEGIKNKTQVENFLIHERIAQLVSQGVRVRFGGNRPVWKNHRDPRQRCRAMEIDFVLEDDVNAAFRIWFRTRTGRDYDRHRDEDQKWAFFAGYAERMENPHNSSLKRPPLV